MHPFLDAQLQASAHVCLPWTHGAHATALKCLRMPCTDDPPAASARPLPPLAAAAAAKDERAGGMDALATRMLGRAPRAVHLRLVAP